MDPGTRHSIIILFSLMLDLIDHLMRAIQGILEIMSRLRMSVCEFRSRRLCITFSSRLLMFQEKISDRHENKEHQKSFHGCEIFTAPEQR